MTKHYGFIGFGLIGGSIARAMKEFEEEHPEIAKKYFDLCYDQISMDDVINEKEELDVIL